MTDPPAVAGAGNASGGGRTPIGEAVVDSSAVRLTVLRSAVISVRIRSTDSLVLRNAPISTRNSSIDASTLGFQVSNTWTACSILSKRPAMVCSTELMREDSLESMLAIDVYTTLISSSSILKLGSMALSSFRNRVK